VALLDIQAGFVLTLITLIALPVALVAFARTGPLWQSVGKGPFAIEQEIPPPSAISRPDPPVDRRLQETEARQMIAPKSYRRQQRGEAPLDVDAEVAALTRPAATPVDDALREEVRQLVVARNERRLARGQDALDVDAEVERQLRELG